MRKLPVLFTVPFLFFLSCSRLELAAMWADSYVSSQIDQYFDISSMQGQFVKKAVNENVEKIKKSIFPKVARELGNIQAQVEKNLPLSLNQIKSSKEEIKKIFYEALLLFEPEAQVFVQKLDERQLESFRVEFERKTAELRGDLLDLAKAKKKRYTRIKNQFESWLGNLTEDQMIDIEMFTDKFIYPLKEQIANREKLAKAFLESFEKKNKKENRKNPFISQLFTDYESMRDAEYVRALEFDEEKYLELMKTVVGRMTLIQKKYFLEVMGERIGELRGGKF